jgi:hypothetical protein
LGHTTFVNLSDGHVVEQDVDLEAMGREIGVLRLWEKVVPVIFAFVIIWR